MSSPTPLDLDVAVIAAAIHAADCGCDDFRHDALDEWYMKLAEAALGVVQPEIERLKANQLPAGGKWEYGVSWRQRGDNPDRIDWLGADEDRCRQFVASHHRASFVRRYVGPVEPIPTKESQ